MKILLVAINAKYIHSNPAVYSLKAYAKEYSACTKVAEYTINHRTEMILQELYRQQPDVLLFSCYIWNISYVCELMEEMHKLMPRLPIWAGGPEVSYESRSFLEQHPEVLGILRGEGEETFRELCSHYIDGRELDQVKGIVYRSSKGELVETPPQAPLSMDELPFFYEHLEQWENRIIYYETSRGCPFSCSYCLSSIEKSLRFRSLSLVYGELSHFLLSRVPQVKFTDRTFNCNHSHALSIWRFLKEHDNGITNFHFEVAADLLTEEELEFLATLRPGLVQLEIGVQSANAATLNEVCRVTDLQRLKTSVERLKKAGNIHLHLDLIAGLPLEGFESFQNSFDCIYGLHPHQLQLGFLKILKGSPMYEKQKDYGILCRKAPPYEVLATKWLTYEELLRMKWVEEMLEVYYNSGQFAMTMEVLKEAFDSPFELFYKLGEYYDKNGLFFLSHSRMRRCEILLDFIEKTDSGPKDLYQETLTFDLYSRERMKSRPAWAACWQEWKEASRRICGKKNAHLEGFYYDFTGLIKGSQKGYPRRCKERQFYLFFYEKRDAFTGQAAVIPIEPEEMTNDKTDQRDPGTAG